MADYRLMHGDALDVLRGMADNSVDAIVCDPPAGINFMQKSFDSDRGGRTQWVAWLAAIMAEAMRVIKPGGHALVWALPRTSHWTACALEDAGWTIKDRIAHIQGQGFPKSLNVTKELSKQGKICQCRTNDLYYPHTHMEDSDEQGRATEDTSDPEDMRDLRSDMDTSDPLSGSTQSHMLARMQRGTDTPVQNGQADKATSDGDVSAMRGSIRDKEWGQEGRLLQYDVLRGMEIGQSRDTRTVEADGSEGADGLDRSESGVVSGQHEWREQSSVEGRGDVQAQQGQLHRAEVRSLSSRLSADGTQGRLHNGASASNGSVGGASAGTPGGGASRRPQHAPQRASEPGTMAEQHDTQSGGGWPVCGGCGKPIVPDGIGSALKPSVEDWWLCRKPLSEPSIAANVLAMGTGAINIDASRITTRDNLNGGTYSPGGKAGPMPGDTRTGAALGMFQPGSKPKSEYVQPSGRFPSHLLLSHHPSCIRRGEKRVKGSNFQGHPDGRKNTVLGKDNRPRDAAGYADADGMETVSAWECVEGCPVKVLDEQAGERKGSKPGTIYKTPRYTGNAYNNGAEGGGQKAFGYGDTGSASRFFTVFEPDPDALFVYAPKASRRDREEGLASFPLRDNGQQYGTIQNTPNPPQRNTHPTVKSTALMRWLCRLITPPGGTVLDMFMGSGSTGCAALLENFSFIGIEQELEYFKICEARLAWAANQRPKAEQLTLTV